MENEKQALDLEQLKTDTQMWMRLAVPMEGSDILENLFSDKDKPFKGNSDDDLKLLRELAAEGKLYMRELGSAQSFYKVETDGAKLNLGEKKDMRTRGSNPELDFEKLKTDAYMWTRLAMSVEGSDVLQNVFSDTENPFKKNGDAAIEQVRKLAADGKLYMRELGQLQSFRKVEHHGDNLNLGEKRQMRTGNGDQELDLEKLKTDAFMWSRLAMPIDSSDVLKNVFSGTENPFEKNSEAAMEKVRSLAADGKLYMRDFGRSRHFRKVEQDGEKLNLGEKYDMRVRTTYSDPVLAALMYASSAYFNWIGIKFMSKWLDGRLERRRAYIEKEDHYKAEYKMLTSDQKADLKKLRAQEKAESKELQKETKALKKESDALKKEMQKAREELDKLQGKDSSNNKGEMKSPLLQPPQTEQNPTMQPVLEGDQQQLQQNEPEKEDNQLDRKDQKQPAPPNVAENQQQGFYLVSGDKIYTQENMHELPEEVQQMLQLIQRAIQQKEAQERQQQQNEQNQLQNQPDPEKRIDNLDDLNKEILPQLFKEQIDNLDDLEEGVLPRLFKERKIEMEEDLAPLFSEEEDPPKVDDDAPLNQPVELEAERVAIQPEQAQQQVQQQEQLREEPREKAQPQDWRDSIVNALFSHDKGKDMLEQYQQVKDDPVASGLFLACALFGVLKQNIIAREPNRNLLDELLNGRSLGDENDDLIRAGLQDGVEAMRLSQEGTNSKPMEEMLSTAVQVLKDYAGEGNDRTPQQELAGMMIEIAEELAKDHELQLPQGDGNQPQEQMGENLPQAQENAPLGAPPDMEPDKIQIQQRVPEAKPLTFPERLEAEKQALEATKHWRDTVANSLFSHQGGQDLMNNYRMINQNPNLGRTFLETAVLGLIANSARNGGEQNNREMLDALLDGRPIGPENDNFVRGAANYARDAMDNPNPDQMKEMLADAVRELGWQAGQEPALSVRHVMIGKLISAAMSMAQEKGLNLGLNAPETRMVQGAVEMGKVALHYENARQYFAANPLDLTNENCRTQLQSFLVGNAVEKAMKTDRKNGEGVTAVTTTHTLMGCGVWSEENLRRLSNNSRVITRISSQELQDMLENPNGKIADKAGNSVAKAMIAEARTQMAGNGRIAAKDMTLEQNQQLPVVQPPNFNG